MVCLVLLTLTSICFTCLVIWAVIMDGLTMTIPNAAVLALLAVILVALPLTSGNVPQAVADLALGAGTLLLGFALFAKGWLGGGDAKLAAVLAIAAGTGGALDLLMLSAVLGGALSLLVLIVNRGAAAFPAAAWSRGPDWFTQPRVPYGIAMGAAALIVIPDARWGQAVACPGVLG